MPEATGQYTISRSRERNRGRCYFFIPTFFSVDIQWMVQKSAFAGLHAQSMSLLHHIQ